MGLFDSIVAPLTGADDAEDSINDAIVANQAGATYARGAIQDNFRKTRKYQQPYAKIGEKGLKYLGQFATEDFTQTPFFKYQQEEGEKAVNRAAAARGGYGNTATVQNLSDFNRGLLSSESDKHYGRLLDLVNIGQGATNMKSQAAMDTGRGLASSYQNGGINTANLENEKGSLYTAYSPHNVFSDIAGSVAEFWGGGGSSATTNTSGGGGGSGGGGLSKLFSDSRLKENLVKIGKVKNHNWYTWDWNKIANKMGLIGKSEGVLADEIIKTDPDAVSIKNGFLRVDYNNLGITPIRGD